MARTLSYSQILPVNRQQLMEELSSMQLAWFQSISNTITSLHEGLQVSRSFYTKIDSKKVPGKSQLAAWNEHELTLAHIYGGGRIESSWLLEDQNGKTKVTYRETNSFEEQRKDLNFNLVSLVFTFFFRRSCKKRMQMLLEQCQNKTLQKGAA